MNLKKTVLWLSLSLAGGLAWTPFLLGAELNDGPGITVDGDPSEWNLAEDFFPDLDNAGSSRPSWPGIISRFSPPGAHTQELLLMK